MGSCPLANKSLLVLRRMRDSLLEDAIGKPIGGFISSSDLLSYFNASLLLIVSLLFLIAQLLIRPKAFDKLAYLDRVRATFIPLKNEEVFFAGEMKKLKLFRTLWGIIFALLFIRVFIALSLESLSF